MCSHGEKDYDDLNQKDTPDSSTSLLFFPVGVAGIQSVEFSH